MESYIDLGCYWDSNKLQQWAELCDACGYESCVVLYQAMVSQMSTNNGELNLQRATLVMLVKALDQVVASSGSRPEFRLLADCTNLFRNAVTESITSIDRVMPDTEIAVWKQLRAICAGDGNVSAS